MTLVEKYIKHGVLSEKDLWDELYEICSSVHSSCDEECPVFKLNKGPVKPNSKNQGCDCFKNGKAMLSFLRKTINC